ncbi:tetratricopeptide repeat-containing sulfotransferase family protein [Microbulbifer sp. ZKSA002]|uniref:tetratricopeptide repeat-containing sulfotransferase family protein n=1 Tax=Microbulbifer sp. ZKSA002 TaxID=3243388 RepID=UPI004039EEEC
MKHHTPPKSPKPSQRETSIASIELDLKQKNYTSAHTQLLNLPTSTPSRQIQKLLMLAFTSRQLKKRSEALSQLKEAEATNGITTADLKFIATEYVALEKYHYAVSAIERIEPMDGQTFHLLGLSHFKLGNIGKAFPIYKKLFSHLQNNLAIARELSLVAAEFRDYETAITAYSRYIQLVSPSASDHLKYADLLLMARKTEESQVQLEKAISMGETSAQADLLKAKIKRLNGNYSDSIKYATLATSKNPKLSAGWQIIAELTSPSDISQALANKLNSAIESLLEPSIDAEICNFALSEIYIKQNKYQKSYKQIGIANKIKLELLKRANNTYDSQKTEELFSKIIETYSLSSHAHNRSSNQNSPIFIVGMPRSGTTLINKIIENSNSVYSLGESEEMPRTVSQLQLKFQGKAYENVHKLSSTDWNQLAEHYMKLETEAEKDTVDKMPSNLLNVGLILSLFPNARIIQVARNPFDVCMSILSKPFPEGHTYACKAEDVAHYYYQSMRLMQFWGKTFPKSIFNLNFDEFLSAQKETAQKLYSFLGLRWSDNILSLRGKSNNFTFSELQVRKPIDPSEAKKWVRFSEVAEDLLAALNNESKRAPRHQTSNTGS